MRIQSLHGGGYPEYSQASTGGPSFPAFPSIVEGDAQTNPNARLQLGDGVVDKLGNVYVYVRFTGSVAANSVVRLAITGDGDIPAAGTISASTTTKVVFSNITTTLNEAAQASFLASTGTAAGSGVQFFTPVKAQTAIGSNTTFTISKKTIMFGVNQFDGDQFSAIPTTGDPLAIIRPYNVVVHAAANGTSKEGGPVGVTLVAQTAGKAGLICVQGYTQALAITTPAIIAGGPVVSAAAGSIKGAGAAAAGLDQDEIPNYVGRALMVYNSAGTNLVPIHVRLLDKL